MSEPDVSDLLTVTQAIEVIDAADVAPRVADVALADADGLVLAGDAFAFLDPVFSSGVFLALKNGEMAADTVDAALTAGDTSAAQFADYGEKLCAGIENMRKLVYAFYEKDFSFAKFLRRFPDQRIELIHLLVGNVFRSSHTLFSDMGQMARLPEEAFLEEPAVATGSGGAR